jgi:hypothetical protein
VFGEEERGKALPGQMAEDRMIVEDVVEDGRHLSVEEEALLLRKCRLNKVDLIEKMIDSGKIGPNFVFSNGETILIIACKRGYKKLVVGTVGGQEALLCDCAMRMLRCANSRPFVLILCVIFRAVCGGTARGEHGHQGPRRKRGRALGKCHGFQRPDEILDFKGRERPAA